VSARTWVVIPTLNEAGSILSTVDAVHQRLAEAMILVVDDQSPDGTGAVIQDAQATRPWLHLLSRNGPSGLGHAYQEGLRAVLDRGAEVIVHCDGDGSHDPALLPKLVQALTTADVAIGSRYIRGGSMRIEWWRQVVSQIGNSYIRFLLGNEVHDWSSGYKAWRATALAAVLSEPLRSHGYACLMEMSARAVARQQTIAEMPLVFLPRLAGKSKFTLKIVIEDIRRAWALRQLLATSK